MSQFSRQVKRAITDLGVSVAVFRIACVAGVRKGRGRGRELGRETTREGGERRGTLARKPLFSPSRLLIKK